MVVIVSFSDVNGSKLILQPRNLAPKLLSIQLPSLYIVHASSFPGYNAAFGDAPNPTGGRGMGFDLRGRHP
jgi:hypothetical protein